MASAVRGYPRSVYRFIHQRLGIPPTYVNRYIGWIPQPMETPLKEKIRRERGNEYRVKEERVKDGVSRDTVPTRPGEIKVVFVFFYRS